MVPALKPTSTWLRQLDLGLIGVKKQDMPKSKKKREFLVKELAARKHYIADRISQKLHQNGELNSEERIYVERKPRGIEGDSPAAFGKRDARRSGEYLNTAALEESSFMTPVHLWRAIMRTGVSMVAGKRPTNGFTTSNGVQPAGLFAADGMRMRKDDAPNSDGGNQAYTIINEILKVPINELREMLGAHLNWDDRIFDMFLSWTKSLVFILVHSYLRHLSGQGNGAIMFTNTKKVKRPDGWNDKQKKPEDRKADNAVEFYSATELCDIVDIYDHRFVQMDGNHITEEQRRIQRDKMRQEIHYRKLNHEYLIYGPAETTHDNEFKQVSWEDFVENGLFDLIPEMKIPENRRVTSLYVCCRYLRVKNYKTVKSTTCEELDIAERLARLLMDDEQKYNAPNLWLFLHFLTLRKRGVGDNLLQERIRRLGYTRADLDGGLYPGYQIVPANLPECASLLNLLRDAQAVVGGEPLEDDIVISECFSNNPLSREVMNRGDEYFDKIKPPKFSVPIQIGDVLLRRCGAACNCCIWRKRRKSRDRYGGRGRGRGKTKIKISKKKRDDEKSGGVKRKRIANDEVGLIKDDGDSEEENLAWSRFRKRIRPAVKEASDKKVTSEARGVVYREKEDRDAEEAGEDVREAGEDV